MLSIRSFHGPGPRAGMGVVVQRIGEDLADFGSAFSVQWTYD